MKRLIFFAAIFVLAFSGSLVQAQDTVQWSYYRTVGNQSAVTSSRMMLDTATEGSKSRAFYFSLPTNTYVEWHEKLNRSYVTPFTVRMGVRLNLINIGPSQSVRFQFFLKHGDSLTAVEPRSFSHQDTTYGWSNPDPDLLVDTENRISSFDELIIRFYFNPPTATGFAEIGFDKLRLVYFNGVTVDSTILIDRFGDDTLILPVELTSFKGMVVNGKAFLEWNTATEVNNYGFEVERKTIDNPVWSKIGFVSGSGTSNAPHDYSFTDADLPFDRYSYRLKQIDRNGAFEYSGIIEVTTGSGSVLRGFALTNYPNPWNPSTVISFTIPRTALASLKVYNVLGQEVATLVEETMPAGKHSVRFESKSLPSGVYFYRLTAASPAGEFSETKRMLTIK